MLRQFFRDRLGRVGVIFAVCLLLAAASSLMAQTSSTGALTGTITDPSGAVVANATVTATNVGTGQSRTSTTGADGTYKFGILPPGTYSLRVVATGFQTLEVPSVAVNVTETENLDRVLQVGTQTQTVTVEGSVETVQTTSSALGTVAAAETVTALPLNTRNYTNLLSMTAGANANVENASTLGKGSVFIAVNGAGFGQNTYLQDGVSVDSWFSFNTGTEGKSNASFALPIPDAIAEFKIQTSSYDAGFGRNPGANVNVVTKTGTNSLHGSGFEFFRNTALNANSFFNNLQGIPKGILNANQYGGTVGGPIKKDKLFFFVSYQETYQKNSITGFGQTTPNLPPFPTGDRGTCPVGFSDPTTCTAAAQTFISNLAYAMCPNNPLYAPTNATVPGNGTYAKYETNGSTGLQVDLPPGETLPGGSGTPSTCGAPGTQAMGNINPVAINLLQAKLPNGQYLIPSSGTAGFKTQTFTDPAIFRDHNAMANLDYVINDKHTLSTRYQYEADPQNSGIPSQDANTAVGVYLPGEPGFETHLNQAALVKLTSIISSNAVNQFNVAYERLVSENSELSTFTNSQFGIADLQSGIDQLSYITTPNFSIGAFYQYGTYNPVNQFQVSDQYSWEHGKHSFRTGFGVEHIQSKTYFPGHAVGNVAFASLADFLISRASVQSCVGCTAAAPGTSNGYTSSNNTLGAFGASNSTFSGYWHVNEVNAYIQDDFKLTPRLTFNVGVRWEYDGDVTESQGLMSSLWPSLLNTGQLPGNSPATGSLNGYVVPANYPGTILPGLFQNTNDSLSDPASPKFNFAPRGGFAWQPLSSSRLVVRGGAGLFYDVLPGNTILNMLEVSPPALIPPVASPTLGSFSSPFQPQPATYTGTQSGLPTLPGWIGRWVDFNTPNATCPNPTTTPCTSNISLASIPQNLGVPVTYEWNLNTQYEFIKNWVLEVAYVGSHGVHQAPQSRSGLQGQASAQAGYNLAQLAGTPQCTSCALTGATTNTTATVPLRVPYLGISPTATQLLTNAAYKYNAAQVTVRRTMSHGLQVQADYTYARGFITEPFGFNTYPYISQQYEPNNNYHPNRFSINYVWNIPAPQYKGIKGQLVDGWSWAGVTTIQDGVPLTITDNGGSVFYGGTGSGSTAQLCPGMTDANLLTTGKLTDRVSAGFLGTGPGYLNGHAQGVLCGTPYWNGTSFTTLAAGQTAPKGTATGFGSMGGGAVLGPGQNNWDMTLSKTFPVRENQSLLIRAEFFNTFNHAQFQIPNLSANQGTFGQITTLVVSPRVIQLAMKYSF